MGDVISVEVDGELGPPSFDDQRRPPRWGMPIAACVVTVLLAGLGWTLMQSKQPAPAALPATSTTVSTPTTPPRPTAMTADPAEPAPVLAARYALEAWGRFAGSGDPAELDRFFAGHGDQLAQLQSEVGAIEPGEPYLVRLENALVTAASSDTVTVTGDVSWSRGGEPDQHYRWAIDLDAVGETWLLITVRTAS